MFNNRCSYVFSLFCLLYCLPSNLYAQDSTLLLSNTMSRVELLLYATMLEDPTGNRTLHDVIATNDFQPLPRDSKNTKNTLLAKGLTQSTFWFQISLINQSDKIDWYFSHWGGLSRHIQLYLLADNNDYHVKPFVEEVKRMQHARAIQYHLSLPRGISYTLYFKIEDKHTPLPISPELLDAPSLMKQTMEQYPAFSIVVGSLLALALYNFIYFTYLNDKGFLSLSFFILAFVMEMGNHAGLLNYYSFLRDNLQSVGSLFAFSLMASGLSLLAHWLDVQKNLPQWYNTLRYVFWVSCGLAAVSPFMPYSIAIAGVWGGFLLLLTTIMNISFYRKGLRLPRSMLLSGFIFIASAIPALLRGAGLIGDVPLLINLTFPALLISLLLLSLTQAEQVRYKNIQAERIATSNKAKDEFLTTMSHELRTPMNAVVNAGHLLMSTPLSALQHDYVSRLNTSSKHMLSLVSDILDLARVDSHLLPLERITFSLDVLLKQLEQLVLEQAKSKQLTLVLDNQFLPFKKQLLGDPTRLQQVLLNLLNNAIKFTEQGEVRLTITPQQVSNEKVQLHFEVCDTGIGLSAEQQKCLFQPFSQADSSTTRRYGGSGLGLAISYKLIQRMNSELQVESQLKQGSRFFFSIKLPLQTVQSEAKVETRISQPLNSTMRILLVDDDEMNRFFGSKIIKTLGIQVETAESGAIALHCIRKQHFDGVFMDVSMPDMNGYETTQQIRADSRFVDLPIVALTAHAIAGERERCLAAGMDDYLTKPFEIKQLRAIIQQWSHPYAVKQ